MINTLIGITNPFDPRKGLRHGDSLSFILFNFSPEKVAQEAILDIGGTVLHKSVQILAHADDVIVERYGNSVKDAFNRLEMEAKKEGSSVINYDKNYVENDKPKKKSVSE